jgi:hypothetical protein
MEQNGEKIISVLVFDIKLYFPVFLRPVFRPTLRLPSLVATSADSVPSSYWGREADSPEVCRLRLPCLLTMVTYQNINRTDFFMEQNGEKIISVLVFDIKLYF